MSERPAYLPETWLSPDGEAVSCHDKLAILRDNLEELRSMAQDALDDAVLMGCDERQIRKVLGDLVATLEKPFA